MTNFFHMDGYGLYVWLSYGITFLVLILNILLAYIHKNNFLNELSYRYEHDDDLNNRIKIPVVEKR
tara:strand:- start:182 stop:379 length:198 start_codon:yes stop_codon:yes gene_type:complete